MDTQVSFRFATPDDTEIILGFIKALAQYEKLEHEVVATSELLNEWIFEKEKAEVIFAVVEEKKLVLRCSSIISQRF